MSKYEAERPSRIHYRLRMGSLMLFADTLALGMAGVSSHLAMQMLGVNLSIEEALPQVLIFFAGCLALFSVSKMYPGAGISPAVEIQFTFQYSLMAFISSLILQLLLLPNHSSYSLNLLLTWIISAILILLIRWTVRIAAVQIGLWREPVLVVASAEKAHQVAEYFHKRLRLGFWPVMVAISDGNELASPFNKEISFRLDQLSNHINQIRAYGIQTAIIDNSGMPEIWSTPSGKSLFRALPRLIFLTDFSWVEGASIQLHDLEGLLGVEARQTDLSVFELTIKRVMDFLVALALLLVLSPVFLAIALLIWLDSDGPILFRQDRIGQKHKTIRVYKFRTMVSNARELLIEHLTSNDQARMEWQKTQKLKDDPRITRVGRWLRKFSLDELPQLYNILIGELSLVGPRPITQSETHHYGDLIETYSRTKPGLTGLWQVSGRNNTTYEERVRFDTYYTQNWSLWLDIYIVLRTIWVVLSRDGAY